MTAPVISLLKKIKEFEESHPLMTLTLASEDVRRVLDRQQEHSQSLTTKLNILFVTNGALLTSLTLSRLLLVPSVFTVAELLGFFVNFSLLINAFLPRQMAITPNLNDRKFLERYLELEPDRYQLQMLVNLIETYNANKQRLDDISQSLSYAAYATWALALVILLDVLAMNFWPALES